MIMVTPLTPALFTFPLQSSCIFRLQRCGMACITRPLYLQLWQEPPPLTSPLGVDGHLSPLLGCTSNIRPASEQVAFPSASQLRRGRPLSTTLLDLFSSPKEPFCPPLSLTLTCLFSTPGKPRSEFRSRCRYLHGRSVSRAETYPPLFLSCPYYPPPSASSILPFLLR